MLSTWRRHLCSQLCCSWSIQLTRSLLNFAADSVCQHCCHFCLLFLFTRLTLLFFCFWFIEYQQRNVWGKRLKVINLTTLSKWCSLVCSMFLYSIVRPLTHCIVSGNLTQARSWFLKSTLPDQTARSSGLVPYSCKNLAYSLVALLLVDQTSEIRSKALACKPILGQFFKFKGGDRSSFIKPRLSRDWHPRPHHKGVTVHMQPVVTWKQGSNWRPTASSSMTCQNIVFWLNCEESLLNNNVKILLSRSQRSQRTLPGESQQIAEERDQEKALHWCRWCLICCWSYGGCCSRAEGTL